MFTGIIEETGTIISVHKGTRSAILNIGAAHVSEGLKTGESVNTNGACLTVTSVRKDGFTADVMAETIRRTNLQYLKPGSKVNLERAMKLSDRIGGHLVSGHIDGMGTIIGMKNEDNALWITISAGEDMLKYIVFKGSVAIDGISLTVADLTQNNFSVSLIPYTLKDTTLGLKNTGDPVNLECDMVGKYIERFLNVNHRAKENTMDEDFLKKHGFI